MNLFTTTSNKWGELNNIREVGVRVRNVHLRSQRLAFREQKNMRQKTKDTLSMEHQVQGSSIDYKLQYM